MGAKAGTLSHARFYNYPLTKSQINEDKDCAQRLSRKDRTGYGI